MMKIPFKTILLVLSVLTLVSCSKGNDKATILDASGKHPANWVQKHASFFRQTAGATDNPATAQSTNCTECHGKDLKGGNVKVSCFSQSFGAMTCHFHPAGYATPQVHGAAAKAAPTFSSGLDSCSGCHGSGFAGGFLSTVSCFTCHGISAPHAKNWATSTTSSHSNSDPGNAATCYQCHAGGRLLKNLPAPPAQPAGTPPSCFNNTLCHGGLHPVGWINPAQHGTAAKSQPGTGVGFTNCKNCHGNDFKGGSTGVSCFSASSQNGSCHLRNGSPVNAPHAALPWRATSPAPTHTSTVDDAQGSNAAVCAQCHLKGANLRTAIITSYAGGTPGCFNGTLCHASMGHPAGWADPAQHGATAKANLTYCQTCHSNNPGGGPGSNPRFNVVLGRLTAGCETCHGVNTAHPPVLQIPAGFGITSLDPLGTPWFRHRTATNFDVCNRCHGANLEGGIGPRCQNCHLAALPTSTINNADPCSSCHSQPPSGTVYPNINGAHSNHLIINVAAGSLCNECHLGFGSGTLSHFNKAKLQPAPQIAGIAFNTLSKTGSLVPAYNSATQQCTNTYCHGNAMPGGDTTGTNRAPVWTGATYPPVLSAAFCDKCHGFPPTAASGHPGGITIPAGFPATASLGTTCSCHGNINPTGNSYATIFVNKAQHINGTLEVSSGSAPHAIPLGAGGYPGASHKSTTGVGCLACHPPLAAGSPYPAVPSGTTPPNCRGCHLNANPTTDPKCSDCHGSAANDGSALLAGRPSGAPNSFPNRAGEHNRAGHVGRTCTTCHPFTTGDTRHGWSNRTKSTTAQVGGAGTSITSWNPTTKGCTPTCHGGETW
ncbi:CxxxxCH/CxxCH domain c-type cytochrome [Pelotalea chapellei]|uniref:CxxxxCH/CxxCH domain-containing protein n=1 Tax=Pelotalea chapellei TaxID=44671 RepID=A0ABS5U5P7_9BACT|nr:CxxxxCH/CxxCH domain-containing protein [Pelotalea chapellei]MBT1070982.1 CxxxxCH/CxxCH domain-containing protein [Pelotalea chapellei]